MAGATSDWSLDEDAVFHAYQGGLFDFAHLQQLQSEAWFSGPSGDGAHERRSDPSLRSGPRDSDLSTMVKTEIKP